MNCISKSRNEDLLLFTPKVRCRLHEFQRSKCSNPMLVLKNLVYNSSFHFLFHHPYITPIYYIVSPKP